MAVNEISVILTSYNRPYTLNEQIDGILNQSVDVKEIIVWHNKGKYDAPKVDPKYSSKVKTIVCDHNWKFHGRFAAAQMLSSEYIALFDDDVIPGKDWFKSCLQFMKTTPGIMGTTGVILRGPTYTPNSKVGWNSKQNTIIEEVDLVGHAWFFKKEWAKYMWYEEPVTWDNGEDIMFSYLCQKYGNIKTYVPPHPPNNLAIWGNKPETARKYGGDAEATYKIVKDHYTLRNKICKHCIQNGWKIVKYKK
jgi:glycosyltransferase involved in cell wall biosynthesis